MGRVIPVSALVIRKGWSEAEHVRVPLHVLHSLGETPQVGSSWDGAVLEQTRYCLHTPKDKQPAMTWTTWINWELS